MAKLKSSARAKAAPETPNSSDKAEQLRRSISASAQQIWMAGVGAFTRAQEEGTRLFEALVKEGMSIESRTRKMAGGKVEAVREAVGEKVDVVRGRAADTWDRLEKVFEERVQRALNRLGVPGREELSDLVGRVDALTGELKKFGGKSATKSAAKRVVPVKKVGSKRAAKAAAKAPASTRKAAAKVPAVARKAARKSLPKAARPVAP